MPETVNTNILTLISPSLDEDDLKNGEDEEGVVKMSTLYDPKVGGTIRSDTRTTALILPILF